MTAESPPPDLQLRDALGSFMTGVTIVTTRTADGENRGMTANSFSSVSLSPPLVSVCIGRRAGGFSAFADGGGFAVSVLAENQGDLAAVFSARSGDRFAHGKWREGFGGAILQNAAAWLDCEMRDKFDGGDHLILVGRVRDFSADSRPPLGFFRGRFFSPTLTREAVGATAVVGAIVENEIGEILLMEKNGAIALPTANRRDELSATLEKFGAAARLEFLFAVFENAGGGVSVFYRGESRGIKSQSGAHFFSADKIPWMQMDSAERSMLSRYLRERDGAKFGVYAGGYESGDIRSLAK